MAPAARTVFGGTSARARSGRGDGLPEPRAFLLDHEVPVNLEKTLQLGTLVAVAVAVPLAWSALTFLLAVGVSRRVAVGSVLGAIAFPVAAALGGAGGHVVVLGILLGVAIALWHRGNLVRLVRGEEPAWRFGSSRRDAGGDP